MVSYLPRSGKWFFIGLALVCFQNLFTKYTFCCIMFSVLVFVLVFVFVFAFLSVSVSVQLIDSPQALSLCGACA